MNSAGDKTMNTIHTMSDVRTWAQNMGCITNSDERMLVEAIRNDGDGQRPAWGLDWSDYLDRIDVAATVLAGEVCFIK
jgi:hypothetical protein